MFARWLWLGIASYNRNRLNALLYTIIVYIFITITVVYLSFNNVWGRFWWLAKNNFRTLRWFVHFNLDDWGIYVWSFYDWWCHRCDFYIDWWRWLNCCPTYYCLFRCQWINSVIILRNIIAIYWWINIVRISYGWRLSIINCSYSSWDLRIIYELTMNQNYCDRKNNYLDFHVKIEWFRL